MATIVLISCVSKKLSKKAKARDLYTSPLFKYNLKYALSLSPDKIFILSAKYGLLDLDEEVEPYNKTLNKMKSKEIEKWAEDVLNQLKKVSNLDEDEFIFLAGENYRKFLISHIKNYKIPMKGLCIGKQLKWLKEKSEEKTEEETKQNAKPKTNCHTIHQLFNNMPKLKFPFNNEEIPLNGIYILFEKQEPAHGVMRIVRIGTHTGESQLRSRLFQHFLNENKDRSIFRKNIGRALLNKNKDPFLKQWELDLTTKEAKEKHFDSVDFEKQKQIEKQVSKYIQDNFTFVVFQIDDKDKRLELESKLISTISLCDECKPSENWFGLFSPKEKIRQGGLWLVNELWKTPLSGEDIEELKQILGLIS